MDPIAMAFASGWASGINAYATVVVLGLFARFSDAVAIPEVLGRTDVLTVSGMMFLIEAVVDKIPWIDSGWDAISTVVRPAVGTLLGTQLASSADESTQVIAALLGGGTALTSHCVKCGIRLAVNTSPEPVSNSIVSTAEDFTVAGVMALAVAHPWWAVGISASLLLFGAATVIALWRPIARARRAIFRERWPKPADPSGPIR